jgi:hypothetical protein
MLKISLSNHEILHFYECILSKVYYHKRNAIDVIIKANTLAKVEALSTLSFNCNSAALNWDNLAPSLGYESIVLEFIKVNTKSKYQ